MSLAAMVLFTEQPWADQALCAQTDPEIFHPEKGGSTREAKKVCVGCDVRRECLEYALGHDERFGVWGGLSERERRALKDTTAHEQRRSIKHGTEGGYRTHIRRGEPPCEPCRTAARRQEQDRLIQRQRRSIA